MSSANQYSDPAALLTAIAFCLCSFVAVQDAPEPLTSPWLGGCSGPHTFCPHIFNSLAGHIMQKWQAAVELEDLCKLWDQHHGSHSTMCMLPAGERSLRCEMVAAAWMEFSPRTRRCLAPQPTLDTPLLVLFP